MSDAQEAGHANESGHAQRRQAMVPGRKSAYVFGVASGLAVALYAPLLRPAFRSALKGFIYVRRHTNKIVSNVKEQIEDISAEAQAEIDREEPSENE